MKKVLSAALAALLALCAVIPITALKSEAVLGNAIVSNSDSFIFTSDMLTSAAGGKGVESHGLVYADGRIFLKYSPSGGDEAEHCVDIVIPEEISVTEYPYFKIGFRAYVEAINDQAISDINIGVSGSRYWTSRKPTIDFSGEYSELCFSAEYIINGDNGGKYSDLTKEDTYTYLRFKPWGTHTKLATSEADFFMVEYVAFFKNEETADVYTTVDAGSKNDADTLNISTSGGLKLGGFSLMENGRYAFTVYAQTSGKAVDATALNISFSDKNISVKENPIVKISYVSDIASSSAIDFNVGIYYNGSPARLFGPRVDFIGDGKPHTVIIDLSKLKYTGGSGAFENTKMPDDPWSMIDDKLDYLRLKPYNLKNMTEGEYFGIEYIKFFSSIEEAETYNAPIRTFDIAGDITQDGTIDSFDVLYLARHLAGAKGYESVESVCADIDNDGKITAADLTLLARKLAGWQGYESLYYQTADEELVSKLDSEFDALKESILAAESDWQTSGESSKVYYVSGSGDDKADGLSPETAWKSLTNLTSKKLKPGDVVLFERGCVWRERLSCVQGITYSAYGEGEKPAFYGSVNAANPEYFTEVGENLYLYNERSFDINTADVGAVIFDEGKAYGCRIIDGDNGNLLGIGHDGLVSNGIEKWYRPVKAFSGPSDLEHDLEYYLEPESGKLYIYSDKGNPASRFTSIELSVKGNIIRGASDCTIDNLAIKYGASHGIGCGTVSNLTIRNCEIGWIGGAIQGYGTSTTTRFGNGIEIYGGCDGFNVYNNYVYECFDCGLTVQDQRSLTDGSTVLELNAYFHNNAVERCNSPLEAWLTMLTEPNADTFKYMNNVVYENNLCRDSGYGFGGYIHSKTDNNMFYGAGKTNAVMTNCYIRNNKMWRARKYVMKAMPTSIKHGKGFIWEDNLILVNSGLFGLLGSSPDTASGSMTVYNFDDPTLALLRYVGAIGRNRFYKYSLAES